ncbi:MAG: tetratricopeptide repeat protein, partial [Terriglobales bacterium]
ALDTFRALLRAAPDARGATLNCVRLELALHEPGRARRLLAAWLRRHPRDQEARQLEAGSGKTR